MKTLIAIVCLAFALSCMGESVADYFPHELGRVWEYTWFKKNSNNTYSGTTTAKITVVQEYPAMLHTEVAELGLCGYEKWSCDGKELIKHSFSTDGNEWTDWQCVYLKEPLVVGNSWSNAEQSKMGFAFQGAKIVQIYDSYAVGSFDRQQVFDDVIMVESKDNAGKREILYFAKGVGLVERIVGGGSSATVYELDRIYTTTGSVPSSPALNKVKNIRDEFFSDLGDTSGHQKAVDEYMSRPRTPDKRTSVQRMYDLRDAF